MHWRSQCNAKWQRGGRNFSILRDSNPSSPTHCDSPQPPSHGFVLILREKVYMNSIVVTRNLEQRFCGRIVVLRLLRLNIKARHVWHDIPEFLTPNLWSIHFIAFDIDWSWKNFISHIRLTILAQFSLSLSSTSKWWELRTWNLGQIVEIELWIVGSGTQ